jgi:hypothetical protein
VDDEQEISFQIEEQIKYLSLAIASKLFIGWNNPMPTPLIIMKKNDEYSNKSIFELIYC